MAIKNEKTTPHRFDGRCRIMSIVVAILQALLLMLLAPLTSGIGRRALARMDLRAQPHERLIGDLHGHRQRMLGVVVGGSHGLFHRGEP